MTPAVWGSFAPLAALLWPLLLGLTPLAPFGRRLAPRLLPLAPLPALALALSGGGGVSVAPDVLLGMTLDAAPERMALLAMTAAVWTAAGLHAALTLPADARAATLAAFWCLTLAGNVGVFLAGDVATFYTAFAAVSLASWFLVIHERTAQAVRAARVYIVMAVLGEAALLAGLLIAVEAAGAIEVDAVRAALAEGAAGLAAPGLLIFAFGIKAGLVPLHFWLPLAHTAAPAAGSAALSGAIVKAGVLGALLFTPPGAGWGEFLIGAGLVGAFGAALWGLTQRDPKAVLAYSTVSQMGLVMALVGAGQEAASDYATHHGLAKGALFLAAGLALAAPPGRARMAILALAALVAASIAGFPGTGGALAKAAAKHDLGPELALAVKWSGATTTLILVWFVHRLAAAGTGTRTGLALGALAVGPLALGAAALAAPWLRAGEGVAGALLAALRPDALIEAGAPVLVGLAAALVAIRFPPPARAPGDVLGLLGRWAPPRPAPWRALARPPRLRRPALRLLARLRGADAAFARWSVAGGLLLGATLLMAAALMAGR